MITRLSGSGLCSIFSDASLAPTKACPPRHILLPLPPYNADGKSSTLLYLPHLPYTSTDRDDRLTASTQRTNTGPVDPFFGKTAAALKRTSNATEHRPPCPGQSSPPCRPKPQATPPLRSPVGYSPACAALSDAAPPLNPRATIAAPNYWLQLFREVPGARLLSPTGKLGCDPFSSYVARIALCSAEAAMEGLRGASAWCPATRRWGATRAPVFFRGGCTKEFFRAR